MIRNSFIFLPRILGKKEKLIWSQGVLNWSSFLNQEIRGISQRSKSYYNRQIGIAKHALSSNDSTFFCGKLPAVEMWRLYTFFREETVFLDIETSSATNKNSYLTVIGLFDGTDTKVMIKDFNLDIKALQTELKKYKLIVTFNGSIFDAPYLNKKYPGLLPNVPHFDLRHACNKIGLKGGLKEIEKQLGIKRSNIIVDRLYGGDPLKLWRMFKATGDNYYLELLVEYNEEDVINLKTITEYVVFKLREEYNTFLN